MEKHKIFIKKPYAGFTVEQLLVRIPDFETLKKNGLIEKSEKENEDHCLLCSDPNCIEYANVEELDDDLKPVGWLYHVSQCQLEKKEKI